MERLDEFVTPHRTLNDTKLPGFDFNPLVSCLNDVISKSLSTEVFQTSSHRFYFKNAHESLGNSRSLCVMRGYDYTIKPTMGKVFLNVNIATSAFFQPITAAEFMADRSTFTEHEVEKADQALESVHHHRSQGGG
ncbi:hypothetical protein BDU57DRAFT_538047 [Ampelomyces quisqualis]|uniref:Argonaute linker 1 domain-containing protein n=1 Tax=Ampelomyces quisqualis TaxID=50730 RepID=A0A6A5QS34_AMPQU|nr:hypothetical protein BDU57DRAFT_538047 [Ampelomyces quisqualis]